MTNRVTGEPKELFRRYRRLGIYEYMHVRDTPPPREAVEFRGTEIWEKPIPYSTAIEYLEAHGVATNNFVTAQEIPNHIFLDFYRTAFPRRLDDASPLDSSKFC